MNKFTNVVLTGIIRYINKLSNFGSKNTYDKNSLIIMLFINQIINGPMGSFVTEEDYRIIDRLMYYLNSKSCIVNYNSFVLKDSIFNYRKDKSQPKLTETDSLRKTDIGVRFHIL